ncbi:MAG: hypothetical protein KDD22_06200 [Bdellovibrionales bacterium]|nr:hypothetical protein [Bdellovibrionales bacterium]
MYSVALMSLIVAMSALGCSSYQVARDVKLLSLTSQPNPKEVSYGTIQGKSCQWSIFGYPLGESPKIRTAFENAAKQKDGGAIPGLSTQQNQDHSVVSVLRNVSTDSDYMSLYVVGRACVNVQGLGAI